MCLADEHSGAFLAGSVSSIEHVRRTSAATFCCGPRPANSKAIKEGYSSQYALIRMLWTGKPLPRRRNAISCVTGVHLDLKFRNGS